MVFTRRRSSTRPRGTVEFTLLALGDWLPRLADAGGGPPGLRRHDEAYLESIGNKSTYGRKS